MLSSSVLPVGIKLGSGGIMITKTIKGRLEIEWHDATMSDLAEYLSSVRGIEFPVLDMTGLTGRYDFTLREVAALSGDDPVDRFPVEDLGLQVRLVSEIRHGLVIDHIEKPTPN
jgi:uncharacterized protein (TIGR03435 family)